MQTVTIVDYGVGNIASIANMLRRVGASSRVASTGTQISDATSLILPGVGSFDGGMRNLLDRELVEPLRAKAFGDRIPILGLCLGMQLMAQSSEEGTLAGLGWIDVKCVRFRQPLNGPPVRIPHMGWNAVDIRKAHPLTEGVGSNPRFYFVHAYHLDGVPEDIEVGRAYHGRHFPAIIARDNVMGVQFHPEKSHRFGMALLRSFAEISGAVAV